jgi:hypothetical protein
MNFLPTRAILTAVVTAMSAAYANAQQFQATLAGFNETPLTLNSPGQGTLTLHLDRKLQTLNYTLTYSNLPTQVLQAHIHFGQVHLTGGIMVFFCSNLGNGPVGTPLCPQSGTLTGQFIASSVIGPAAQGISAGNFDALVAALLSNSAYGNVHTQQFPGGEIRGQIRGPEMRGQGNQH